MKWDKGERERKRSKWEERERARLEWHKKERERGWKEMRERERGWKKMREKGKLIQEETMRWKLKCDRWERERERIVEMRGKEMNLKWERESEGKRRKTWKVNEGIFKKWKRITIRLRLRRIERHTQLEKTFLFFIMGPHDE